jgi:hypothetical protein
MSGVVLKSVVSGGEELSEADRDRCGQKPDEKGAGRDPRIPADASRNAYQG